MEPARFADRVAIVTGSSSGVGLAVARRLQEEGAYVVGADLRRSTTGRTGRPGS